MSLAAAPREKFADLFTPKLVSVWREGYGYPQFQADFLAGLTVAIVALPLSTAIAIASGATPQAGLIASAVGGLFVSALGGSRFQIGGPAGAFIVLVATTIEKYGYSGFLAATLMAGFILLAIGYLRLGAYIKYIPHSVTVGFTAAIGLIIFTSQLRELFGLRLDHEPAAFVPKVEALWAARYSLNPQAIAMSVACLSGIVSLRIFAPRFPGLLVAVVLAAAGTFFMHSEINTIGSRFGELPRTLPMPSLPAVSLPDLWRLFPAAIAIAVLGGVESLLSAVVADGMTGRRHRSNCELAAQGWANIASALFGGLCVTGAIARTATNIRAGAHGPVAGMLHSLMLMGFMLVAAPLAAHIPLAALAAVLTLVAWNMIERDQIVAILKSDRGEALILLVTAGLTVFEDIIVGIAAGVTLGALIFMHKMAQMVAVETGDELFDEDHADNGEGQTVGDDPDFLVYSIAGPFFFGAVNSVGAALDQIGRRPKTFVLDLARVPLVDGAGAHALHEFIAREKKHGVRVILAGASRGVHRTLVANGVNSRLVHYSADVADARDYCASHALDRAIVNA